jgi:hypothetical protein
MKRIEKQARATFAYYHTHILNNQKPKALNTEKFANFIAQQTKYNLTMVVVPMGEVLRGIIVRNFDATPKEALILVSDSNNECWSRFTIVKEVCHLFLEHEKDIKSDNALEMAQSLVTQVAFMPHFLPSIDDKKKELSKIEEILHKLLKEELGYKSDNLLNDYLALSNPIGAEEASAVVAAIEIMIPIINKEWISEQIKNKATLYDLSNQLKVPKLILEYRLDQWYIDYN